MDLQEMRFRILPWACLVGISMTAHAQTACPAGTIPYGVAQNQSVCGPAPSSQRSIAQQAPAVGWESRWGAIAADGSKGILGTASNAFSRNQAEASALSACNAKGGGSCVIQVSYSNSCAAMIVGDKGYNTNTGATLQEATDKGMRMCNQSDAHCQIYYSDCSLLKRTR